MFHDILVPICTGLTVFLFALQVMRISTQYIFTTTVKRSLEILTGHPLAGFITGIVVTALLQSSSAVLLIIVTFIHTRALSFRQGIAVMLGANVGTTVTLELLSYNLGAYSMAIAIIGFLLFLLPTTFTRCWGLVICAIGLLFIGMEMMQEAGTVMDRYGKMNAFVQLSSENTIAGMIVGTILTAIVQSSTAVTALTMSLAESGTLALVPAIAILLGSNIGTCVTVLIGSIGTTATARRLAYAHVVLNTVGALLFLPFLHPFSALIEFVSHHPAQQIAHAQLLFNSVCSAAVLPFLRFVRHHS